MSLMNGPIGHCWPNNVGIVAIEVYFPKMYVEQTELEIHDGVSPGKYTIGLGQSKMGFCSDREDICCLCLNVVQQLMSKNNISYDQIGRLEVGTETIIDKSKSVKSVLMQLFQDSGNSNIEGVDTINACYGGTAALFNAVNWIESTSWDGRYAVVVAGDIAVYASGSARPTGGAGAVAMLIAPNAPLILDRGLRGIHMEHVYDFYKPNLMSEYPVVDGKLSIQCYFHSLDKCYKTYCEKSDFITEDDGLTFSLDNVDAVLFHSPYCKLVQKSFARLAFNDFLKDPSPDLNDKYKGAENLRNLRLEETYFNKEVEKTFMLLSKHAFEKKTQSSLLLANQVGNMYTPSLYGGLCSMIANENIEDFAGKRILLFSYGSGLASSMFSLTVSKDCSENSALNRLHSSLKNINDKLNERIKVEPSQFEKLMKLREETHHLAPYSPVGDMQYIWPHCWFIEQIDEKHRRKYDIKQEINS